MKIRRKKHLAACLAFLLFSMMLMPLTAYAAGPKEGDYVDPVEYYDLAQFAGMQLTAQSNIRDAILDKEFLPVELVLKPLKVSTSAIRLAHGNSGDLSPLEDYTVFQGEPWVIKHNEKSSFTVLHETGNAGTHHQSPGQVLTHDYNYQWQSSVNLTFDDVLYYIEENNWTGKFFNLDYQSAGSASSSGSQEHFQPENNRNITFTSKYAFEENVGNKRIRWFVDDTGILKLWIDTRTTPGGIFEEWRYENPSEISRESMDNITATVYFQVEKVKLGKVDSASGGAAGRVDTRADKDAGETGVSIPEALAIVIIGGAAAMAGAGGGGSDGGGDDNGRKKKRRYKMCLKKDFGDAIRYNAQPVTVYARIVEITPEGEEIDRPDLSAVLEMFSGGGLKVESTAMAGNYMGALVCAESVSGGANPDSGVLSIRFSGEGGSFQNDVTFRLVGEAYIHFPERGQLLTPTTYMLYGDNGDYEVPIELLDFTMPPQKVRLEMPGDQPFTAEAERVDDTHYKIRLHNSSQAPKDQAQPQQIFMVTVYAENEQESAHDSFIVNLLPEGLSLRPFTGCPIDENGRLHVAASLAPEQGEDETEIEKTHFQLVLAVSKTDENERTRVTIVDSNSMNCRFEPMTAQSEKLQNLLRSFPYEMDFSEAKSAGIFRISPQRQLPQDDRLDYDVALPVSCDYENQTYTLDIPLRLIGDKLLPMAEKSEEISLLIKRIKKYVDEEDRAKLIREFKNDLPKMSATDVRLLSKSLVYATQAEVYKANRHLLNAEMLDWVLWGLDWYKWIGDQAISVIISKLSYNYAPFVEAIVMPAKDLMVEHMGIWLADYVSGAPSPGAALDLEQLESTGITMIENTLTNLIDGKTEPKKAAQILSVYLVIRTAHAYYYEKNDDGSPIGIYGAVASAFGDLTAQSFKIILGTKLEQLAKNPATTKMFGGYADEFVKGLFPAEFYNNGGKWEFDLIKKYIEEITVLASAKVYSGIQKGAEQDTSTNKIIITLIESAENPGKTVRISVTPMDLGKDFFDYIFDRLFGMFSFADSVVESPKDPPCMLA